MKTKYGMVVCFIITLASNLFAADGQWAKATGEKIIFIGNPGAGKSSLLNSLMGKTVFRGGLCAGEGMTRNCQFHSCNGITFVDTPGLNDIKYRKEAALEIEKALKGGGTYRIFYVLNLKFLRVLEHDVAAMNLILDAINAKELKFNVIVNGVTKREMNSLNRSEKQMADIIMSINSLQHKTDKIIFIPEDPSFEDAEGTFVHIEKEKRDFIFNSSSVTKIKPEDVTKIQVDKYEELKKKTDEEIENLRKEIAKGSDRIKDLIDQIRNQRPQQVEGKEKDAGEDPILPFVFGFLGGVMAVVAIMF